MSWQKVKLGQFLKNREGRYKPNDKAIQGLKRIDKINFSGTIFLSDKPSNTDMILVKKGDLVISGINVEKGAMNIYQGDEDVVATIHYSSYEFDEEKIDIDFLTNFLKSLEFKKALKEQVPGGIKTEIKPKHILPLLVEIPTDIKEQRKVVKKLIEDNSIIENFSAELNHQLNLIKQLRQAFLREAMQGKLCHAELVSASQETGHDLLAKIKAEKAQLIADKKLKKEKELAPISEDEIPFEIPAHWAWCRLGEICIMNYGKGLTKAECFDNGNYPVFGSNGIVGYYDVFLTEKKSIIIGRKGSAGALNISSQPSWTTDVAYYIEENDNLNFSFLNFLLKSLKLEEIGKGIKPGLNRNEAYNLIIGLPPLHEQEQIVAKLEELMAFCDGLEQSIKESQGYNEMLLQQVLREALQSN